MGISPGTDGVVIELPHPGLQEYRQKQIKLSLYRGGTGFGSGKVSLKVRTLDGSKFCLLYTSPSPRDATLSRMPSSA